MEGADLPVISEQTDARKASNQQEVIELDEAGVEDVREKRFQDLLEKADTSDIIEFDDELEDIVAGKSFASPQNSPYAPDIVIGKSLSAKAKNYDVLDLESGEVYHFAEDTKIQNAEVFAGKGTKKEFRTAQKYADKYGGRPEDWQHTKGFGLLATPDGDKKAEVHWVQCPGVGKFEFFVKKWNGE